MRYNLLIVLLNIVGHLNGLEKSRGMSCHPPKSVNYLNFTKNVHYKVAIHVQHVKENNVRLSFCWKNSGLRRHRCLLGVNSRNSHAHTTSSPTTPPPPPPPAGITVWKGNLSILSNCLFQPLTILILSCMASGCLQSLRLLLHLILEYITSLCLDLLKETSC